jgi:hypothetical protein
MTRRLAAMAVFLALFGIFLDLGKPMRLVPVLFVATILVAGALGAAVAHEWRTRKSTEPSGSTKFLIATSMTQTAENKRSRSFLIATNGSFCFRESRIRRPKRPCPESVCAHFYSYIVSIRIRHKSPKINNRCTIYSDINADSRADQRGRVDTPDFSTGAEVRSYMLPIKTRCKSLKTMDGCILRSDINRPQAGHEKRRADSPETGLMRWERPQQEPCR